MSNTQIGTTAALLLVVVVLIASFETSRACLVQQQQRQQTTKEKGENRGDDEHNAATASMICFHPGSSATAASAVEAEQVAHTHHIFNNQQRMTSDDGFVLFVDSNCSASNRDPLLLLCGAAAGKRSTDHDTDLPCQCPHQADIAAAASSTKNNYQQNQLMCANDSPGNLEAAARLLLLVVHQNEGAVESVASASPNALLILCRFYSRGNLMDLLQRLLGRNKNSLDSLITATTQQDGANALMLLLKHSKSDKIAQAAELLIEKGVDVNHTDREGMNALLVICSSYSQSTQSNEQAQHQQTITIQLTQLLIEKGIDVHHQDAYGANALIHLCHRRRNAIINAIPSSSDDETTIVQVIELLIEKGIDIHHRDNDGKTAADYLNAAGVEQSAFDVNHNLPDISQFLEMLTNNKG